MAAFPQFVPRLELGVHLKSIDGRFDDLIQRISGHQEQQVQSRDDLERLSGSLQDLATKLELNHLGSRLDLQIACTDVSVTEGLEEQREYTTLEVQALRTEMNAQIGILKGELATMSKDIVSLGDALAKEAGATKETYATKAEQSLVQASVDRTRELAHAQLKSAISAVEGTKVSYQDLEDAIMLLRSADDGLAKDIAKLAENITQTSQSLVCFDQQCQNTFATHASVSEVSESVQGLQQRVTEIVEAKVDVHGLLENERDRMREHVVQLQELGRVVNEATDDVHHLKSLRSALTERCERNEQELRSFGDMEKMHWQDCQKAVAAQKQATAELHETCGALRTDMELHILSAKGEAEKLRQHSTMRYFDQLDKALAFQETVDRVQRDNQELNESMRTIKLPKM